MKSLDTLKPTGRTSQQLSSAAAKAGARVMYSLLEDGKIPNGPIAIHATDKMAAELVRTTGGSEILDTNDRGQMLLSDGQVVIPTEIGVCITEFGHPGAVALNAAMYEVAPGRTVVVTPKSTRKLASV